MTDLADLIETFRSPGLTIELQLAADPPGLSAGQQLAIYRFAQEALTNVVRHSEATTAQVSIVFPPGEVSIEVVNDGDIVTPNTRRQGQGLIGMAERMAALGGTFNAVPRPHGGFQVKGRFPATLPSAGHRE